MVVFPKIMTILTDLAVSNSISSFVPKYWLNWQILMIICVMNFVHKDGTTKMCIPVHLGQTNKFDMYSLFMRTLYVKDGSAGWIN